MSRFKKLFVLLCVMNLTVAIAGCSNDRASEVKEDGGVGKTGSAEYDEAERIPKLSQVQSICELATLECYYHNVAKSVKEPGTGLLHLGEKERPFWMEYTGIAEISFEASLIKMEQHGEEITITLPPPKITCRVDPHSWSEDSYIISKDQWLQKNPITAEDQTEAIEAAQADMQEKVENNLGIMNNARIQAEDLIANYIHQIGQMTGVEYQIIWKYESAGDTDNQSSSTEEMGDAGGRDEG